MKSLMKKTGMYLLAFMVAVVSPGCTTTQPMASEPPANTDQKISSESGSETTQAQENQAGTVPEEKTTEGGGTSVDVNKVAGFVLGVLGIGALIFLEYVLFACPC